MIVDTCFVLDLLDGAEAAFEKGVSLRDRDVVWKFPVMTVAEVMTGYGATNDDDEVARRVENVLLGHPVTDADERIARRAGWIMGETGLDHGDAFVGATALHLDEPVLTRNVSDFERIDDLAIETY